MSVEEMWHRPVCVGAIVCYAVFISVLPFLQIMLRTYWRVMPWWTIVSNDSWWWELKKKGEELLLHSPCLPRPTQTYRLRSKKTKMHCKTDREIALNLFSIFTVYNIFNVIYIYSQLFSSYVYIYIYICTSSIALTFITLIENRYPAENTVVK